MNREDNLTVLQQLLDYTTYYYKMKKKFYSDIEIDEFEFFNILKSLKLVRFEKEDSYDYFSELFDRFYLRPDSTSKQYWDFFFVLFGMPTRVYEDEEIKDITIEPLFRKYKIKKDLALVAERKEISPLLYSLTKRTFTLGYKYLDCLKHPTEENIADLIEHYQFKAKSKKKDD